MNRRGFVASLLGGLALLFGVRAKARPTPYCAGCGEAAEWTGNYGLDMCYCEPCDAFTTGPKTIALFNENGWVNIAEAKRREAEFDREQVAKLWEVANEDKEKSIWLIDYPADKVYGIYPDTPDAG